MSSPSVIKRRLQPDRDGFAHGARYDDAAGRRFSFQAGRDIDAVAVKIVTIDNQVAKMQADAEHDLFSSGAAPGWCRPWPAGIRSPQTSASTALANSTRAPSPVSLTSRPP